MISFSLDEEQQLIRETVHKVAADLLRPRARDHERARALPSAVWSQAHELGLAFLTLPETLGGQGASMTTVAIVEEELAWGDASAAVALGSTRQALYLLGLTASDEQQRRLVAPFVESGGAERAMAVAYADVGGVATVAKLSGEGFVLDGLKGFVVDRGGADVYLVWAQLEGTSGLDGVALFAVDGRAPALVRTAGDVLLGLDAVGHGGLTLTACPAERLGTGELGAALRRWLAYVAVATAARQLGLLRASYEHALAYTQERKAFGKAVAHFQAVAFALADMATEMEATRGLTWAAAAAFDRGQIDLAWSALAHANQAAWSVADDGVQLLGGAGFVRDYPAEKWLRETQALALFAPPSELVTLWAAEVELGHSFADAGSALQPFFT